MVATHLAVERADQRAVGAQEPDQRVLHRGHHGPGETTGEAGPQFLGQLGARCEPAAAGSARSTTEVPGGQGRSGERRTWWRSRRLTRLRTTALPTALLTTKPTRGGRLDVPSVWRCTTSVRAPARRPERTVRGEGRGIGQSMSGGEHRGGPALRPRGSCGPCGGGRRGSRGRHGCASAGGTRASCDDDGCSAGTYACSRDLLFRLGSAAWSGGDRIASFCRARRPEASGDGPCMDRPTVRGARRTGSNRGARARRHPPVENRPARSASACRPRHAEVPCEQPRSTCG